MTTSISIDQSQATPPLTEKQRLSLQKDRLYSLINESTFSTDRKTKLISMYDEYGDQLLEAPASSKEHYHNAYAGGYIDHILHVHDCALEYTKTLKKMGGVLDYTKSELIMATLHHDLWKLGLPGKPYYLFQDSDWHREKRGELFKHNDELPFMEVTDGALFILQSKSIELTENEWLSIKLSDGLYDESNKSYLMNYGKFPIHSKLPYIVHWADHMSTSIERDFLKSEFLQGIGKI